MPSYAVKQSSTAYPLVFLMIDSTDHVSAKTGLSPTVTISKAGGSFASPSGAVTEISAGWYKCAGNATDSNTLGPLLLHATGTGADPTDMLYEVVAVDPQATSYGLSLAKTTNITGFNDIAATAVVSSGAITTSSGAVSTVTTVTNQLTAAQIATGVWQDATAGDFTTASSIGKALYVANIAPGAAGGHFIAGTNAATTITGSLTTTFTGNLTGSVGSVTTVSDKTGYSLSVTPPTAAAIATAVWQDATAGDFTTASSIGKSLYTSGVVPGGAGGHFIAGTNAATTVTTAFTATFTGNLTGSVASVTGAVGSVTAGVTVTTNNDKTGYSLSVTPPTAAAIATAIWTDTTAGDFTTLTSPGKVIFSQLGGAFTTTSSSIFSTASLANAPTGGSAPTAAAIATAVWQDTTSGDFTVTGSPGKILQAQLGGAFTTTSSSIFSTASLANAPTGGSAPTTAQIATAVWTDLLAGSDFSTSLSIGKLLKDDLDATVSSRSTYAGADTSGTTTLLSRLTSTRAGLLDNLDAAISTRSTYAGGDTSGTTTLLGRLTSGRATNLDNLDAAISTRSTYAGGDTSGTTTLLARIPGTVQPQTGDAFALIGTAGAGLTALGDARLANLDAAVSSRSAFDFTVDPVILTQAFPANFADFAITASTGRVTVGTMADKTGYTLAAAGFDSVAVESGINARQALAGILSTSVGKVSGMENNAPIFKGANNNTTRVTAVTNNDGNRTAVSLNFPA